ncbi:MAG: PASTA domain-containing protein [Gaiellaceae bacterium]
MATNPLPREPVRDEPVLGNQVAYEDWLAEDAYRVDWKSQRRRRRRRLRSLLLAILAATLLLALAAGAWIATRGTGSETTVTTSAPQVTQPTLLPPAPARVTMPYLLGIQLREARTVLADQSADLRVRVRRIASRQLVGEVVSQSPPSSSKIAPNAFVALSVSSGPVRIAIPSVEGKGKRSAVAELRGARLRPEIRVIRSRAARAGTVLEQTPAAGMRVEPRSIVILDVAERPAPRPRADPPPVTPAPPAPEPQPEPPPVVAPEPEPEPPVTAPPPPTTIAIPGLVGSTLPVARRRLAELGLAIRTSTIVSSQPKGVVIRQFPKPGSRLREGQTVSLTLSAGPALARVPGVIGLDDVTAADVLEAAGFEVRIREELTSDIEEDGIIIDQEPSGGRRPKGSIVTITVASYDGG